MGLSPLFPAQLRSFLLDALKDLPFLPLPSRLKGLPLPGSGTCGGMLDSCKENFVFRSYLPSESLTSCDLLGLCHLQHRSRGSRLGWGCSQSCDTRDPSSQSWWWYCCGEAAEAAAGASAPPGGERQIAA